MVPNRAVNADASMRDAGSSVRPGRRAGYLTR